MTRRFWIEDVPFSDFVENFHLYLPEADKYWQCRGDWIEAEMDRRGWSWIVICGGEIVAGSANDDEFPGDEEKIAIGEKYDHIPFAYSKLVSPGEVADFLYGSHFCKKRIEILKPPVTDG